MDFITPSFVQVCWSCGWETRRVVYAPSLVYHVVAWMRELYPSFNPLPTAAGRELTSGLRGRRMEELALSLTNCSLQQLVGRALHVARAEQ